MFRKYNFILEKSKERDVLKRKYLKKWRQALVVSKHLWQDINPLLRTTPKAESSEAQAHNFSLPSGIS